MGLKLLQGPITCTADPFDPDFIAPVSFVGTVRWHYYEELGLCGNPNPPVVGQLSWAVMNLDGVMFIRKNVFEQGAAISSGNHQDLITGKAIGYWGSIVATVNVLDPQTGFFIKDTTGGGNEDLPNAFVSREAIRLHDRWWDTGMAPTGPESDEVVVNWTLDGTGGTTVEYTFDDIPTLTNRNSYKVSAGRDSLLYIWSGNQILTYDYQKRVEVLPRKVPSFEVNKGIVYSRKFDIFIGIHEVSLDQDEMYIWANELEPDSLSAPVDLTPVTQGRVSTIQTTLTDSDGTGIVDRLVDWSITAGNGTLGVTQSVTDENGIAENTYRAELTGGVDPTIQVDVTH
jgi:hypothetical protein